MEEMGCLSADMIVWLDETGSYIGMTNENLVIIYVE